MHYLALDTNTWIYLANGTEPAKLLNFIQSEADKGNIKLLVPQIIIKEWNANKEKAVKKTTALHFNNVLDALERIIKLLGDKAERAKWEFLLNDEHKKELENAGYFKDVCEKVKAQRKHIENAVAENIRTIDELFNHRNTVVIDISDQVIIKASQLALEKKAPFGKKNSFADALIFFSFIKYVRDNSITGAFFITYNTDDFCLKKDNKYVFHPDLEPELLGSGSKFYQWVGEALKTIENDIITNEELELIAEAQEYKHTREAIVYCDVCDEMNGWKNEVHFHYTPTDLIDTRHEKHKSKGEQYRKVYTGGCSWCNTEHILCVKCGTAVAFWDGDYDKPKECEGGCGLIYLIDTSDDRENAGFDYVYMLVSETSVCEKCGEDFIVEELHSGICNSCEDEYSYG
jgi:hypothetical protein